MHKKNIFICLMFLGMALILAACAGGEGSPGPQGSEGPAGPAGPKGDTGATGEVSVADLTCTECHNDTPVLFATRLQWDESKHATGTAYGRGTSSSCAGCHSGEGFSARIAAGIAPNEVEEGVPNSSPTDCRTCHQIHTTYTGADFALESTDPVTLFVSGETFDMGLGNLCANCHQPRRAFPEAVDGQVEVNSTHWGPHLGVESAMLLGVGGAIVEGSPSAHYSLVSDGCPACHMGDARIHTMVPDTDFCTDCHTDLEDFDRNGVQTEVHALVEEVAELLKAKGLLDEEGHPVVGFYPEAEAAALWNFLVIEEDASGGVHNSAFAKALLEQAKAALE